VTPRAEPLICCGRPLTFAAGVGPSVGHAASSFADWARQSALGLAKAFAWMLCGAAVGVGRLGASLLGRRRKVDVLIYKVDRLGDWLLAEPSVARIVADARARGASVVIWGADESLQIRRWREPGCAVESFSLDPIGAVAKFRRAWAVIGLLSVYQARILLCLRHFPDPVRDFVLGHADSCEIRALSLLVYGASSGAVPHEIIRHSAILAGAGLAPRDPADLLPRISGRSASHSGLVVLAPYSSGAIKDWVDESWVEVAHGLHERGLRLELWVSPGQAGRAGELARKIAVGGRDVVAAVRCGSLNELAGAMAGSALVVSVDTFAAHLAAALDVPLVSLIGGGQYGDFGPWRRSARQLWLSNPLPCFGCSWRCSRSRVECMEDIRPDQVLRAADDTLRIDAARGPAPAAAGA
jgi:Glycosyltransferase family 9 (heptosyltransferase)